MVLPLPEATGSTQHRLASLGLRLLQHMIVTILHDHCTAAEMIGSKKAYAQSSVVSVRSYNSLQTAQKMITNQNRVCSDIQ
jgi:hypothetical protein